MSYPPSPDCRLPPGGFTLIEVVLAAALLALVTVGVLRFTASELEREELNAVAIRLSGWLQSIQAASMQLPIGDTVNSAGCLVTFTAAPDGVAPGDEIARVFPMQAPGSPTLCHPDPVFRMPGIRHGGSAQQMVGITLLNAPDGTVIFTPRGTVTNTQSVDLVLRHRGQSQAARCVRISAISGLIELGVENTGQADRCSEETFNSLI